MAAASPAPTAQQEIALDALGNSVRRQLLAMIGARPRSVSELAGAFPISRPAISRHLAQLTEAGFVAHDKVGTQHIYRINDLGFSMARGWLDGFWNEAEARLRMVAENTQEAE